jgi:hypothetical protein
MSNVPDLSGVDFEAVGRLMKANGMEVPVDWEAAAKEQYGGYYAIIQSVPEIGILLKNATSQGWSEAKFDYELKQTSWYKNNSASARTWDTNKQLDPASAQQQIDSQSQSIRAMASNLGVFLDDTAVAKLAENSLRGGWNETVVQNSIGAEAVKSSAGKSQLSTGYFGQQMKNIAADYGIQLADSTFDQWINKVAVGQENVQSFKQYALNMAKTLYPSIGTQLDQGLTFAQITDPYKQTAARTLEINPDTIDFTDPKWSKAITFSTDKGEQRPMNFNEWGNYLRSERSLGYEYTNEARSRAYQVTSGLANLFGKI